jgi:glutathione S-transferase
MRFMSLRLYTIPLSHSAAAARLMLEYKGIDHVTTRLLSGVHPALLRLEGFPRGTVPAVRQDGERVQGSLAISRFLEALRPEPPLFPADPERRDDVEVAEAWGERVLQVVPRRLFRWALVREPVLRRSLARINRLPAPGLMAVLLKPLAGRFAKVSAADDATVRRHLRELPGLLDHADGLVSKGVIGAGVPNAATFQIAPSLDLLSRFPQLQHLLEGRPSMHCAGRWMVDGADAEDRRASRDVVVPEVFPASWVP